VVKCHDLLHIRLKERESAFICFPATTTGPLGRLRVCVLTFHTSDHGCINTGQRFMLRSDTSWENRHPTSWDICASPQESKLWRVCQNLPCVFMHVFTVMGAVLITHQSLLQRSPSDTEPHKTHANSKRRRISLYNVVT